MRLNLPIYQCVQFGILGEFNVPLEKESDILSLMGRTHTHGVWDEEPRIAVFGSRTRNRGVLHRVRGRLTMTRNPEDLSIELMMSSNRVENLRPPPRQYRPVSQLVEESSNLFGPIEVNCNAVFDYDQKHGYRSKISFPVPLMMPEDAEGITHIESAQFSRRYNDELDYTIIVLNPEDSDSLMHSVTFKSILVLSRDSIKDLVDRARSISTRLLVQEGAD